jgi:hypothetical protein
MDWQIIKLFLKAYAPLAVVFYLIVIFGFRLFTEDKDDDI